MNYPTHIVAVGGLVYNPQGKILLMRHPVRGWEFPGGQVENGEDIISALVREVNEETGIEVLVKKLAGVNQNIKAESGGTSTKVIFDFICEYVSGNLSTSEESQKVGWFDRDQALKMVTLNFLRDRLDHMLKFNADILFRTYSKDPDRTHLERMI